MKKILIFIPVIILFFAFAGTENKAKADGMVPCKTPGCLPPKPTPKPMPKPKPTKKPVPTQNPGSGGNKSTESSSGNVRANFYYVPYRDEYRVDYEKPPNVKSYVLNFVASDGRHYTATYTQPPTGIHYLNCNGTYSLAFYDVNGRLVGQTGAMKTSQMQNPKCKSYADGVSGQNDMNVKRNPDGSLEWTKQPGTDTHEVWKDGRKVGETKDNTYPDPGPGGVSIVGKDKDGNTTGESDINLPGEEENGDKPPQTCGNVCKKLEDLMSCPGWGDFMGQWGDAVKNAQPPPPDWDKVTDQFRDKVVPAMGEEMVKRAPDIAKSIADEFQSREKPVEQPGKLPNFNPDVPKVQDMPGKYEENLRDGVPNFQPDYSGDSGTFSFPDPGEIKFEEGDKGYEYGNPDLSSPDFKNEEPPVPGKKYDVHEAGNEPKYDLPDPGPPPTYDIRDPGNAPNYDLRDPGPAPNYEGKDPGTHTPDYSVRDPGGSAPKYNVKDSGGKAPDYNTSPGGTRDYNVFDPGKMPNYHLGKDSGGIPEYGGR